MIKKPMKNKENLLHSIIDRMEHPIATLSPIFPFYAIVIHYLNDRNHIEYTYQIAQYI